MPKSLFPLLLFLSMTQAPLNAQRQTFDLNVVAGLNFSELEGDGLLDYFGINTGLLATAKLSEKAQLGLELLFSQNGEYVLPDFYPDIEYGNVWLNHLEVPVHFDWLVTSLKTGVGRTLTLSGGFAYARLLSFSAEHENGQDVTDEIIYDKRDGIQLQTGITYYFSRPLGMNLRFSLPASSAGLGPTLAARILYRI